MIFRVLFFIFVFVPIMIVIIPAQALINALKLPFWNVLPRFFHRIGCIFLGLRVTVIGQPATGRDGSLYLTGMGGANGWSLYRVDPASGGLLWNYSPWR